VGTCAACFTYGAAAGIDASAGVACLVLASRRARRSGSLRGLGVVALAVAGSTGLLCAVHHGHHTTPTAAADQALALATISAVLPLVWFVATAWSHQEDDDRLPVAGFHLLVAVLFALNRYDALAADRTIDVFGPILVQPMVLPVVVAGCGVLRRHRRDGAVQALIAEHETLATAGERDRIARELHDSVTQTLYSVAMVADGLPRAVGDDPGAARRQAGQIRSMTLTALGDLQVLVTELRPSRLGAASLGELLRQMADAPDGLVRVELDVDTGTGTGAGAGPGPPDAVRSAAHRIAHQAVANARRHAAATAITVRLRQRRDRLELTVTDDGTGFDPTAVPPGRHGLAIMRERAASVDGVVRIDSSPGTGTVLRFSWPAMAFPPTTVVEP
jgi:signal transduction histidine kinase